MTGYLHTFFAFVFLVTFAESCFFRAPAPPAPSCNCCPPPPPPPPSCGCGCGGRKKRSVEQNEDQLCPDLVLRELIKKSLKATPKESRITLENTLQNSGLRNVYVTCEGTETFEITVGFKAPKGRYCIHGDDKVTCKAEMPSGK
ncbi:hypothetical protein QR680_015694 [Steinernema hermaphroditum]|uniref:Ground-like domain-containing protein n=1 Tax=Steinernema hermaphroditum TaxID=289476 RepID=A0AA39HAK3_9BILA|nr:hypothetical protein QR680_015694 [Steinernema hermaphroditum]